MEAIAHSMAVVWERKLFKAGEWKGGMLNRVLNRVGKDYLVDENTEKVNCEIRYAYKVC